MDLTRFYLHWLPLCLAFVSPIAQAQDSAKSNVELTAQFGFVGHWKLGIVCPVRVEVSGLPTNFEHFPLTIELQTLDGDGVTVSYKRDVEADDFIQLESGSLGVWMPIKIGRQRADVTIRLLAANKLLSEKRLMAEDFPPALPSTQPLIVALGSSQGVESASSSNVASSAQSFTTATIQERDQLPDVWQSYYACDVVIVSTNDLKLLRAFKPAQWQALDRWICDGGACIVSLGPNAQSLTSLKDFSNLLPGAVQSYGKVTNPGPLESHVGTNQPMDSIAVTQMDAGVASVELTLLDSLNRRIPWLLRHPHGCGTIQTIASDLEQPSFVEWADRNKLWRMLLGRFIDLSAAEKSLETQVGTSSYLGYDDLVGQLRAALDVFPTIQVVSFGQAAALVVALLLAIGPLDYFLSVKWFKRPDYSWYFAGAMLTIASLGLVAIRAKLRPDEIRVNTAQIVDIDVANNNATGHLWSHIYSGKARQLSVDVQTKASEKDASIDWQGLPGRGLGGLLSQLNADLGMPSYSIQQTASGQSAFDRVGVPAAGTKCICATWHQDLELQQLTQLKEIRGIDQLEGTLVNPLKVDLKDCMLFYHHWYYSMPSRIQPGQAIRISFETIPKDLPRRLNGRRVVEGNEQITPWNPSDRNSIPRLLEMMMFYKMASGPTYTTLLHRYQPQLDFSNLLATNRAMLIGRLDEPLATVNVTGDSSIPTAKQDLNQAWCRLVFPVEQNPQK